MNASIKKYATGLVLVMVPLLTIAGVGDGASIQLTDLPGEQLGPSIDGTIIVYTDVSSGNDDIYYTDLLNPGVQVLVAGGSGDQRLHDVSGDRIVYTDDTVAGGAEIFVYDISAGNRAQISVSTPGEQNDPSIDGNTVVYVSANNAGTEIGVVDLITGVFRLITTTNEAESAPIVAGHYVVYERRPFYGSSAVEVVLYDLQTDTEVDLGQGRDPHTDGTTVVFASQSVLGDDDIVVYDIATATRQTLVEPGGQTGPHIDGDVMAYDDVNSSFELRVMIQHLPSGERKVISGAGIGVLNDVSGRRVAYTESSASNGLDIYVYEFTNNTELFGVHSLGVFSRIDPANGQVEPVGLLSEDSRLYIHPAAMAVRPGDGQVFTWANADPDVAGGVLLTVDVCTGLGTPVNSSTPRQNERIKGLAFAPDGQMYAAGLDLFEIDPATGVLTRVGPSGTGIPGDVSGLDFDVSGNLYAIGPGVMPSDSKIYTLDTASGIVSLAGPDLIALTPVTTFAFDTSGLMQVAIEKGPSLVAADRITGNWSNLRQLSWSLGAVVLPVTGMDFAQPCPVEVAPRSLNFGDVETGTGSLLIITVSNAGQAPLTVDSLVLSAGDFSVAAPATPFPVAAGDSVDINVTFAPATDGIQSETLQIVTSRLSADVALSGNGVAVEPPPSEQVAEILVFFDNSVVDSTLAGAGNGNSAGGRLGALRNMIKAAGDLIDDGQTAEACQQLLDAYERVDGNVPPPDFADGASAQELAARIQTLRESLECL